MGAGDTQGVAVALHDRAPGLGPLVDGDAPGDSAGDLRVVVVDGGGADDGVAVLQVVGGVSDGDGDAHGAQVLDGVAVGHVRALDGDAHAVEHLGQGAHGHAADAGQVDALAGVKICVNVGSGMEHSVLLLDRS